jgi:hypothetical protein
MTYITIKYKGHNQKIKDIGSLNFLKSFTDIQVDNLYLNLRNGKDSEIEFVQIQREIYWVLRGEYFKSEKRNKDTLDLISKIDSAIESFGKKPIEG